MHECDGCVLPRAGRDRERPGEGGGAAAEAHLELPDAQTLGGAPGDPGRRRAEGGRSRRRGAGREAGADREAGTRGIQRAHLARVEIDEPGRAVRVVDDGLERASGAVEPARDEAGAAPGSRRERAAEAALPDRARELPVRDRAVEDNGRGSARQLEPDPPAGGREGHGLEIGVTGAERDESLLAAQRDRELVTAAERVAADPRPARRRARRADADDRDESREPCHTCEQPSHPDPLIHLVR